MSVRTEVLYRTTFECNESECKNVKVFDLVKVQATAQAREQGWTIARSNRHYCPKHPRRPGRQPSNA